MECKKSSHLFYLTNETRPDDLTHIEDLEHVDDCLGVRGAEPRPEHAEVLVGAQTEDEVTAQLPPATPRQTRPVEVEPGLARHEYYVEALDEADGVDLAVVDVGPNDQVVLPVDVPQLEATVVRARVDEAPVDGSAGNLQHPACHVCRVVPQKVPSEGS